MANGAVEGMIGFARRPFMVPLPRARDIAELNAMLRERSTARQQAVLRGESETIAARLVKDRAAFTDLPATTFDACDQRPGRLSSQALVRYRNNDYSVPVAYAHREVIVKGYVGEVVITSGSEEIARHRRSYESADFVFDPLHYLPLLEEKGEPLERSAHAPTVRETTANALDQAAPLQGWELPPEFSTLRRLLEARLSSKNRCAAGKKVLHGCLSFFMLPAVGVISRFRLAADRASAKGPKPLKSETQLGSCSGIEDEELFFGIVL